jgi:hypothetical protein
MFLEAIKESYRVIHYKVDKIKEFEKQKIVLKRRCKNNKTKMVGSHPPMKIDQNFN